MRKKGLQKAFSWILLTAVCISACAKLQEDDRMALIVDADTANEVDDLYAIVRAIKEPGFNLLGITSAQFHTSPLATDSTVYESQQINEDIVRLMGREDIPLPLGSNRPLIAEDKAQSSPASRFIIEMAHQTPKNEKLNVAILGSCTNVASAILEDPEIIPKLSVHYIGFWHDTTTNHYNKVEFNTGNDSLATNLLLNTEGLDFNVMTATTCQHLVFEKSQVDAQLKGKGGIADYLVQRWDTYERWWTKEDPEKKSWIMWDVAIIEALAHPDLSEKQYLLTPKDNTQRLIGVHTKIAVDEMIDDFWESVSE